MDKVKERCKMCNLEKQKHIKKELINCEGCYLNKKDVSVYREVTVDQRIKE